MSWEVDGFGSFLAGRATATQRAYVTDIEGFVKWAQRGGADGPDDIDRAVLRRYLAFLTTRKYARASVARKAAALRSYFSWLTTSGVIKTDPARRLSAHSGSSRLPRVLDRTEMTELLDVPGAVTARRQWRTDPPAGTPIDMAGAVAVRDHAVLELLYGCGLRVSELCGLD
ncbi:MAG: site-specific integrase, partial [Acidimicrobiales bacterium]